MITYVFDTYEELGMFVDFCQENNIPVDFDMGTKTASVPKEESTETEHFYDYYHDYQMGATA